MEYFLITPLSADEIKTLPHAQRFFPGSESTLITLKSKEMSTGVCLFKHYVTSEGPVIATFPGELTENHGGDYSFMALSEGGTLYRYEEEASWQQSDEWWSTQYERWKLYRMTQLLEE